MSYDTHEYVAEPWTKSQMKLKKGRENFGI